MTPNPDVIAAHLAAEKAYAAVPARYRQPKAPACECREHVAIGFSAA